MYEKQSTAETLKALEGNWDKGLSSMQADARRQEYGLNKLKEQKKKGIAVLFFEQLQDPLI